MKAPSLQNDRQKIKNDDIYGDDLMDRFRKAEQKKQENVDALEPEDAKLVGFKEEGDY